MVNSAKNDKEVNKNTAEDKAGENMVNQNQ